MVDYSPALMTDMYEYTMLDAALKDGTADRKCVFEVFTRHLPEGRRYGVVAGTGRILDALEHFHLDEADLKFLADRHVVSPETIKWLENFRFSGTIRGYREGEMFFPNSPILQVEGTFGECTLLETLILSVLNYDSAVASAASRMASAAKDRPCMDMGGRRTNEWAAVAAARAAVVGGFKGTANLLAAQLYGLKAIGTAAHCFTLVHDSERDAFESQIEALGKNTTLLVDTYNIEEAVKTAVTALNLDAILTALETANKNYSALTDARSVTRTAESVADSKTVRAQLDSLYDDLVMHITAVNILTPSITEASAFLTALNQVIAETKAAYNRRKGITAPSKPSGGNGTITPGEGEAPDPDEGGGVTPPSGGSDSGEAPDPAL